LFRLRKILVIKAYNARGDGITLEEQFAKYARENQAGKKVLPLPAVKQALGLKPTDKATTWLDELISVISTGTDSSRAPVVPLKDFLDFLETGRPPPVPLKPGVSPIPPAVPSSSSRHATPNRRPPRAESKGGGGGGGTGRHSESSWGNDAWGSHSSRSPVATPVRPVVRRFDSDPSIRTYRKTPVRVELLANKDHSMYPDVMKKLGFHFLSKCRAVTPHRGTTVAHHGSARYRRPWTARPVWQKREIVLQERIVVYTTVDEDGNQQELVETEKSQTEVLHMECKDTGEFAHREKTDYEQTETFNQEVVMAQRGNEEYVHLKSAEDEFEHMESNMPPRGGGPGGGDGGPEEGQPGEGPDGGGGEEGPGMAGEDGGPGAAGPEDGRPSVPGMKLAPLVLDPDTTITANKADVVVMPPELGVELLVNLTWEAAAADLELASSCLLFGRGGEYAAAADPENPRRPGVRHLGSGMTGDSKIENDDMIVINFPDIPDEIYHLVFTLNIYNIGRDFSEVNDAVIRLVAPGSGHVYLGSRLGPPAPPRPPPTRGTLLAAFSRHPPAGPGAWVFKVAHLGVRGKTGTHPDCLADVKMLLTEVLANEDIFPTPRGDPDIKDEGKNKSPSGEENDYSKDDEQRNEEHYPNDDEGELPKSNGTHPGPIIIENDEAAERQQAPDSLNSVTRERLKQEEEEQNVSDMTANNDSGSGPRSGWEPCNSID